MGTKAKTRFYATINGEEKELFSVREVANDGLLIAPLNSGAPFPREDDLTYRELHFSVHKTNAGQDTMVTHKVHLSNGRSESHAAFVKDTGKILLWPVMFRREGAVSRTLTLGPKDRTVYLGRYETFFATMFYSVFVSLAAIGDLQAKSDQFTLHSTMFRHFQLFTLVSFVDLPTISSGYRRFQSTSTPVIDGVRRPGHSQQAAHSIHGTEMFSLHLERTAQMRDEQMEINEDWSEDFFVLYEFCIKTLKAGPLRAMPSTKIE